MGSIAPQARYELFTSTRKACAIYAYTSGRVTARFREGRAGTRPAVGFLEKWGGRENNIMAALRLNLPERRINDAPFMYGENPR